MFFWFSCIDSILQSSQLESYYVNFYLSVNVGSLIGTTLIPILAQIQVQTAYLVPCLALVVGLFIFISGSKRYIKRPPENKALLRTGKILGQRLLCCKSLNDAKLSRGGCFDDLFVDGVKRLLLVIPISLLTLPFVIAYSQTSTVFILQGEAMKPVGLLDASLMSSFDPISVLVVGFLVGSVLYPALSRRGLHIPLTYKFAIGTAMGGLAIASAIIVDHSIRTNFERDGTQICILWQAFSYILVGCGEIFAFTACLEATFSIAPPEQKGLASALNQFSTVALSSFICVALNNAFSGWFPQHPATGSDSSNTSVTELYANSEMGKFLWVTFGIALLGIVVNILGPVKRWAETLHQGAGKAAVTAAAAAAKSSSNCSSDNNVDSNDCAQSLEVESDPSEKDVAMK
jgi:proton-dependent oligopeptide transporter, POT family